MSSNPELECRRTLRVLRVPRVLRVLRRSTAGGSGGVGVGARTGIPAALVLSLISALLSPAAAHLSMIRQGAESAGGIEAGDQYGFSVATGDFNGDGFDDLVGGAPQEDIGAVANAGAVIVNWGSELGVTHEGAVALWATHMTGSVVAGANLGWAVTAADFNSDGFDDLVVGAPFETINGAANAGAIYILRGSAGGLQSWMGLTQADFAYGVETGDKFGYSLATGDFNDDGHVDLVMGSPGENFDQGAVLWILGTSAGLSGSTGAFNITHPGGLAINGNRFGLAVAAGNVMSGPEDEIVVGAPDYPKAAPGIVEAGAIVVVPGTSTGPNRASSLLYQSPSPATFSHFGRSVDVGRLIGGSYEAVAVGEPDRSIHPLPTVGRVVVFPGGITGLSVAGNVQVTTTNAGGVQETGAAFGQAIAVGSYWDATDGYEDLAVGSPGEGWGMVGSFGQVQILNGGPGGPTGAHGWSSFNQGTLNEKVESVDVLGSSLAFGRFDGTEFGNLAVGAPGEDSVSGMVHIIAPWRQVYGLTCERSIVLDCNEDIYFSQKPFDQVWIASTTKIMTVLLACEHAAVDNPALDDVYTVPAWVEDDIPGSQVPLFEGEWITLEDLMYTCLLLSGNDAAYAIADMIHGSKGPDESVNIFVNEMNAKAWLIGMDDTHFHNPAGLDQEPVGPDMGEHYSTPHDMAILSAYAMKNALFRQIAGTTVWPMVRHFEEFDHFWNVNNFFTGVLMSNIAPMTGIKGGWTPNAQATGCFAAETPLGERSIAGTYATPDPADFYRRDAALLAQLGLGGCGFFYELPDPIDYAHPFSADGFRSGNGDRHGASASLPSDWAGDMEFTMYRATWDTGQPSSLTMWLTHLAQLRGDGVYNLGAHVISGHGPIHITNAGEQTASFNVLLPYQSFDFVLAGGESAVIPERLQGALGFPVQFSSNGDGSIDLDVQIPYLHDVTSPSAPTTDPARKTRLLRGPNVTHDAIEIRTLGHDAAASEYAVFGHAPGGVVAAPELESDSGVNSPGRPPVQLRAPLPNPFQSTTQIGFDLTVAGLVGVEIYDVAGRLVRAFDRSPMPVGAWGVQWDGRTERGVELSPGAYFYRVTLEGETAATGRLTRIR